MFQINAVRIHNFRSFNGKHTFKLPTAPGLYFITGTNEAEPALEANGAGKSTLLEAIHWCLYGRTTRGLRGPDVVTWGEKSAWVEVDLWVGKKSFTVSRTQGPNSLAIKADGETLLVEQDELEKRLRLTADAFKYGVMTPQYGKSFFERTPTEKLEVFSDILNLEVWLERSKAAEAEAKKLEREKIEASQEIAATQRSIEEAEREYTVLLNRKNRFKEEQQAEYDRIEEALGAAIKDEKAARATVKTDPVSARVEGYEKRVSELSRRIDEKVSLQQELVRDTQRLDDHIEDNERKLKKLQGVGATCPTCFQSVDAKHLRRERDKLDDANLELIDKRNALKKQFAPSQVEIDALRADRRRAEADLRTAHDKARAAAKAAGEAQAAHRAAQQRVADLEGQLGSLKGKTNPYATLMAEKRDAIDALTARKGKLEAALAEIEAEYYAVAYWVTGFKRLRLVIIEDTLRTLELEVNNSLASLGLTDWSIALDIEREKKTGGVTKGFHVFVQCPAYDQPVKWESWSGGESQRLQQAGDFGLANLIMAEAGLQGSVEFYDEPSQHLSGAGLLDLAETLHQRAMTQGKVILLIDHHTIDFGEFAGVCRVTKDAEGSYIGPWE